jgi:hypothetical protein
MAVIIQEHEPALTQGSEAYSFRSDDIGSIHARNFPTVRGLIERRWHQNNLKTRR